MWPQFLRRCQPKTVGDTINTHEGPPSTPSLCPINTPSSCSITQAGLRQPGLSLRLPLLFLAGSSIHISAASEVISCFRLACESLGQSWFCVCWGTWEGPNAISTQCVWAGPLAACAWTRVGWSGYPSLAVCLSAAPHAYTLSIIFSLYLSPLYYLIFFPLSCLFTFYIRCFILLRNVYYTFPFPSTVINDDENTALES